MPDLFLLNPPALESLPAFSSRKCGYCLSKHTVPFSFKPLPEYFSHCVCGLHSCLSFSGMTAGLVPLHLYTRVCTQHRRILVNEYGSLS